MKNYNTYITKLITAVAVIFTLISFTSIANDKSSQDLCLETYPRWMLLSGDGNFKVGDTISSNTGVKAIIASYNAESHILNYYHTSKHGLNSFEIGDLIYPSNSTVSTVIKSISAIEIAIEGCKTKLAKEQAAEQAVLDEIAAFEAELAAQQLADNLAAYQAKIDAERALAAKNLAAFEARKAAELAAQLLADNLAVFQAKIDAERALAAKNLAAFQAKQAAEKEIAELAAKLAEELELDKQQAAKLAAKLSAELAAFEAYHSCKARLNLSDANIAKFKAAIAAGNLYNVGPQVANGTDFSPRRWDSFFSCQEPTGS